MTVVLSHTARGDLIEIASAALRAGIVPLELANRALTALVAAPLAQPDPQAVTASAVSTNNIDLSLTRDLASGSDLYVHFSVDENATAVGAATVQFQLIGSASMTLSSPTVLASTGAISKGDLTAGRRPFALGLASAIAAALNLGHRYLGAQYVVAAGPLTTGRFSAVISDSTADVGKAYPSTGYKAF